MKKPTAGYKITMGVFTIPLILLNFWSTSLAMDPVGIMGVIMEPRLMAQYFAVLGIIIGFTLLGWVLAQRKPNFQVSILIGLAILSGIVFRYSLYG